MMGIQISNGYLEKFKSRKKILFVTIHGEANSVEPSVIENWYNIQLVDLIHLIDPVDIYNGDELGLFWRMQGKSSYVVKDNLCKFGRY